MGTNRELLELILEGEHQRQDFKYRIDDARKIARSLVAFANTDGGKLLIGVKDNGNIVGVDTDEELYVIESAANLYSEPKINYSIKEWESEDKVVLEVFVPRSSDRPHFVKQKGDKLQAYFRRDDENIPANATLLKVWEKEGRAKGERVNYGEPQEKLMEYIKEHGGITKSKFIKISGLDHLEADNILVDLVSWNVLWMDFTNSGCYFRIKH